MRTAPIVLLFACTLASMPSSSWAADEASTDRLDTIVVTATRTEQPRELTGTSISVITAAELAARQTLAIADALRETPGLTVVRNGGAGQSSSIGLRGAAAGQTLLLIDGVRLNDPGAPDGAAVVADLFVNNVQRIEVLRGPQSTLYGSDAIGGVINILSQRGGTTAGAVTGSAEAGSLGSQRGNVAINGMANALDYSAAVNYYHTNGISAAARQRGNNEADNYRNAGATGNFRWHVADTVSVDARVYCTDTRTDFDGFPPPNFTFQDTREYGSNKLTAVYAGVNADFLDGRFHNRVALTKLVSDRHFFDPTQLPLETFYARGDSRRFEYQGSIDVNKTDQLTFGAETQRSGLKTASPSSFDPNPVPLRGHARINSYYAEYQTTVLQQLTLTGGVRQDDHSDFGNHNSFKVAAAWQLAGGKTIMRANYGDGFKAPSLYELNSPFSNPLRTLRPESAHGWEVGADQWLVDRHVRLSASYFERHTRDQIDFFDCFSQNSPACSVRPFGFYDNIARSKSRGIEFELIAELRRDLSLTANYTHLEAIDLRTRKDLARRPRVMTNAHLTWTPDAAWSMDLGASYTGARFDDVSEQVRLPGYIVGNLSASHVLTSRLQVYARIENLLDRQFEPVAGYGALPRTYAVGVHATL